MKKIKQYESSGENTTVRLMIPSTLGFEKIAMDTAARLAEIAGLAPERTDDLCTAMAEACINAMQHGNRFSSQKSVDILFYLKQDTMEVEIFDSGEGIQTHPPAPVLERKLAKKEPPRGWGIYLIENLVDEVEFGISTKHGHVTRLIMKLQEAEVV
jgi:serine/threonine-protein kinase RsbW